MHQDRKLHEDVVNELRADPSINSSQIGVTVNEQIVNLTGQVESFYEKWMATKAVQRVRGVQGLTVDIYVRIPHAGQRNDEDLTHLIGHALHWNSAISSDDIQVMVENGWVTLRGKVAWNYQRDIVHRLVAELSGVKGITDHLILNPVLKGRNIKDRIEAALKRQGILQGLEIAVQVDGNQVMLQGTVRNMVERNAIRQIVWSTGGVDFLIDRMRYPTEKTENNKVQSYAFIVAP
jgi:osmotically-inducible protein OsmY